MITERALHPHLAIERDAWLETRRNLATNPVPFLDKPMDCWMSRWGWSVSKVGDAIRWTAPSSQASTGRGWNLAGNPDVNPPLQDASWRAIPVQAGKPLAISVDVRTSFAISQFGLMGRIHDGRGNWISDFVGGTYVSTQAGIWRRVSMRFTPTVDGYVSINAYCSPATSTTLGTGATIEARRLLIEQAGVVDTYFDGWSASTPQRRYRYLGVADGSMSVEEIPYPPLSLAKGTGLSIRRGGVRSGLGIKTDVGLLTFTLVGDQDPLSGGNLLPGQQIRILAGANPAARSAIFTGRVIDVKAAYPLNKATGRMRSRVIVTVADAVQRHTTTPRYGVQLPAPYYETFESRIQRLAGSAQAPIIVPAVGAPREVYSL